MTTLFRTIDRALRRLPDWLLATIAAALVLTTGALRLFPSLHDLPMADFFLFPVTCAAWLMRSRAWAYAIALLAVVAAAGSASLGAAETPLTATLVSAGVRLVFYVVVVTLVAEARKLVQAHAEEARRDKLTGAANARAFHEAAAREIARSRRYGHPLTALYLDVDDFKHVNDTFGHGAGDKLLGHIAHVMVCSVRGTDTVARLGGDEFVALMPETGAEDADAVARRMREDLGRVLLPDGSPVRCSVGVASLTVPPESVDELIHIADDLMYRAKQRGKDRVELGQSAAAVRA